MCARVFCLLMLLFHGIYANAKNSNEAHDVIPFYIYQSPEKTPAVDTVTAPLVCRYNYSTSCPDGRCQIVAQLSNIASEAVSSSIKHIRRVICDAAGDADVKVWFSIGADGKVGVGASAGISGQAGMEIIFHCKEKHKSES